LFRYKLDKKVKTEEKKEEKQREI